MTQTAVLPPPRFPMVVMVSTDAVESGPAMLWVVGQPHPLASDANVVRMFIGEGGVEVYSWDGKAGARDLIPMSRVRLIRESLPYEMMEAEIDAAEAEKDEDLEPESPAFSDAESDPISEAPIRDQAPS